MSSTDPSLQAGSAARPSLLTPAAHGQPPASGMRMLDGLGVASPPKARVGRWLWLLPVFGLGLLGFAWRDQALKSIPSLTPLISKMTVGETPPMAVPAASAAVVAALATGPAAVVTMGVPQDDLRAGDGVMRPGAPASIESSTEASQGLAHSAQPSVTAAAPAQAPVVAAGPGTAVAVGGHGVRNSGAATSPAVDGALRPLPSSRQAEAAGDAAPQPAVQPEATVAAAASPASAPVPASPAGLRLMPASPATTAAPTTASTTPPTTPPTAAPTVAPAAAPEPATAASAPVARMATPAPVARLSAPPARAAAKPARPAEVPARKGADGVPERGQDPDVDLVAAVMAHIAPRPAAATTASPAVAGARPPAATQPSMRAQAQVKASQPATRLAARAPAAAQASGRSAPATRLTLDQRVQQCKAQFPDKEDSRACRRRVCEAHWGRHAACPVRLMARPATTA